MTTTDSAYPPHRHLWSGLISDDVASLTASLTAAEVGVLGVPFDGAASFRRGTAFAPAKLRELSPHLAPCAEEGQPLSLRVRDYGDVPADLEWSRYFQMVEDRAAEVLRHPLALFLGGDHSVTIPLMRAFNRAVDGPFGVLHFDAHPDLCNTYEGHRWSHACTERRALELSGLEPQHLVFVGLRSFIQEEWDFLKEHPEITCYTARQCYRQGIEEIAGEVVERLRDVPSVYFTLDIDGLDPAYAPGTGTPEGGGLATRDLLELVRLVFQELPVRALDVVEVAPPLDQSDITSFAALKVIYEAWWVMQEKRSQRP
ncbi:MAG: agmatinase [Anaerolineae bacterium]|nr:agmatinase [Anaerolineae bacterium]